MNAPALELIEIEKRYGNRAVLGPVSLRLHAGELVGLSGPNGAGKSTLLKIAAGILRPTRGERQLPAKTTIAYVPQETALYEDLSGIENLRYFADLNGLPASAAKARTDWLLQRLSLSDVARKPVRTYSGGMKQRLNLAAALSVTPQLLLLDEPTTGADAASSESILTLITQLSQRGCAILLIDHTQAELDTVCGRILQLENGRLTAEDQI